MLRPLLVLKDNGFGYIRYRNNGHTIYWFYFKIHLKFPLPFSIFPTGPRSPSLRIPSSNLHRSWFATTSKITPKSYRQHIGYRKLQNQSFYTKRVNEKTTKFVDKPELQKGPPWPSSPLCQKRPISRLGMRGKTLEARFCYLIISDLLERVCGGGAHSSAGIVTPLLLTRPKDTRSMKVTLTSWHKSTNQ